MKKLFNPLFVVSFLFSTIVSFIFWHRLTGLAFLGEGPTYLVEPYVSMLSGWDWPEISRRIDVFALLFFYFFGDLFKLNMYYYMLFIIFTLIIIALLLFIIIKFQTRKVLPGFVVMLLFLTSYIGNFESIGNGYYQWFIQRLPNFIFALIGFLYLLIFFNTSRLRYYFLAFVFYGLSMYLARYSFLILPVYCFYILFKNLETRGKVINKLFNVLIQTAPFLLISYYLVKIQRLVGTTVLNESLSNISMPGYILDQITILTLPTGFLDVFGFDKKNYHLLRVPILLFYTLCVFLLVKRFKELRAFVLSLAMSLPVILYFLISLNSTFVAYYSSSRYLFLPNIIVSMLLSSFILLILHKKKFMFAVLLLIVLFSGINWLKINKSMDDTKKVHVEVLAYFDYIEKNYDNFNSNTLYILSQNVGPYGVGMIEHFYGKNNIRYNYVYDPSEGRGKNVVRLNYRNGDIVREIIEDKDLSQ